jgi:formate-dependent nitrite reductase membrane component NrfD
VILIVDLDVPTRFWHMMIQNHTGRLMFKWWSPMSVGVWGLLVFGLFAALASLGALVEEGRVHWRPLRVLTRPWVTIIGALGGMVGGLFLAGYTGVLLGVSNRPIWADSSWLGVLFLISGVSTSAAALILLARWRRLELPRTIAWLVRFDRILLVLELVVIIAFVVSLGPVARALMNAWGVLLVVGVVGAGILAPLRLEWRRSAAGSHYVTRAAALVLVGGFLLRVVVLLSSEGMNAIDARVLQ